MPTHVIKSCPRCHAEFECKAGTILQCQCKAVQLTKDHHAYITQRYAECLCAACLEQLKLEQGASKASMIYDGKKLR